MYSSIKDIVERKYKFMFCFFYTYWLIRS